MSMWTNLGFIENPFDTEPLKAEEKYVDFLIGRMDESLEFSTFLESNQRGVVILSGVPGVGKTSFLNIQQYLIENENLLTDKKLIAARHITNIQFNDSVIEIARRALNSICKSIELYCSLHDIEIPKNTKRVRRWINQSAGASYDFGIVIAGFGGNFGKDNPLPNFNEVSFEGIIDLINLITSEIKDYLQYNGIIVALDNIENLDEEILGKTLMAFRDTLFTCENVWWVIIGQSGLSSLIQSIQPKVFQRITGHIEFNPILSNELKAAIDIRVQKFSIHDLSNNGASPISENIYKRLYESSNGEIRFVFKYCITICQKFIKNIKKELLDSGIPVQELQNELNIAIGSYLTKNQLNDKTCLDLLKSIVKEEFELLNLRPKDKFVLSKIGEMGSVRPKQYKEFRISTMQDFSSNYLSKYAKQNLLLRKQEGRAVIYELRGLAFLAKHFTLLNGN